MVHFCAVCSCCTRTDIVREHLEDTLRICDVSAKGLYSKANIGQYTDNWYFILLQDSQIGNWTTVETLWYNTDNINKKILIYLNLGLIYQYLICGYWCITIKKPNPFVKLEYFNAFAHVLCVRFECSESLTRLFSSDWYTHEHVVGLLATELGSSLLHWNVWNSSATCSVNTNSTPSHCKDNLARVTQPFTFSKLSYCNKQEFKTNSKVKCFLMYRTQTYIDS
jgi:hypothetical protein